MRNPRTASFCDEIDSVRQKLKHSQKENLIKRKLRTKSDAALTEISLRGWRYSKELNKPAKLSSLTRNQGSFRSLSTPFFPHSRTAGCSQLTELRHQSRANRNILSAAQIVAAISIVTTAYVGEEEASFSFSLRDGGFVLPVRALSRQHDTIEKLLGRAKDLLDLANDLEHTDLLTSPSEQSQTFLDLSGLFNASSGKRGLEETRQTEDKFPLIFRVSLNSWRPQLICLYDELTTSKQQGERFLWQIDAVICQLQTEPQDGQVKSVSVISRDEMAILKTWNAIDDSVPNGCVHEIIRFWAHSRTFADAVCGWDRKLSYGALDLCSTRLAQYLRERHNVSASDLVPLYMERSALAIVTMLAVNKLGAAFIPLDPANPTARNEGIIERSGAKVVLSSSSIISKAVLISWNLLDAFKTQARIDLPNISQQSLAYIIFTSGSTGKPKGVMIEHHNLLLSLISHGGPLYDQNVHSRVLQFASLAFDASMTEHLATLVNGGCVCIPDNETRMGGLVEYINQNKVNWAFFTPSVLKLLHPGDMPGLRTIVSGGEAITNDCIERWASSVKLINGYGPSETTIVATAHHVKQSQINRAAIGKGLVCKTWVTDVNDYTRLAPIGAVGELLIQGPTVGRGYLNDPEKTNAAFVPAPDWANPSPYSIIYRTGDLVRYCDDGSLMYVGRKDTQVKVRGQRVEIAEVEYQISQTKHVAHEAVFVPKSGPYVGKLVAIITMMASEPSNQSTVLVIEENVARDAQIAIKKVQLALKKSLPPYMVPEVWIAIQSMPLSGSGKIDRPSLTQWLVDLSSLSRKKPTKAAQQPCNSLEEAIQASWAHALSMRQQQVSIDTSFQSLGGDSIMAMAVSAKCRAANINVSVTNVLKGNSIRELARMATKAVAIKRIEVPNSLFKLSPTQQIFVNHMPSSKHYFNQTYAMRVSTTNIDESFLHDAMQAIVQQHSMLRARLVKTGNAYQQLISEDVSGSFSCFVHNVSNIEEALRVASDSQGIVDIQRGPTITAALVTYADQQLILLTAHHFVIDIVSWRIIHDDLESFVRTKKLPMASLSFQNWLEDQSDFDSHVDILPYPAPKECPQFWGWPCENTYGSMLTRHTALSETETLNLLENCRSRSLEPVSLFISSLILSFAQVFPERPWPVIHNEGHGRESWLEQDLSRTVGWFSTLTPLMIESFSDIWDACSRIQHIRQRVPYKGLPYFARCSENGCLPMEVVINYLGVSHSAKSDSLLREDPLFQGTSGDHASQDMTRFSLFEVAVANVDGKLELDFTWSPALTHQERISLWVETWRNCLTTVVEAGRGTPVCDLSLMKDYDPAQRLLQQLNTPTNKVIKLCPASSIQEAMLQAQRRNSRYYQTRLALVVSASNAVDCKRFAQAWKQVVQKYSILRTVFAEGATGHIQAIMETANPYIEFAGRSFAEAPLKHPAAEWNKFQPHHKLTLSNDTLGNIVCLFESSHALIDYISLKLICHDLGLSYSGETINDELFSYAALDRSDRTTAESGFAFWNRLSPRSCYLSKLNSAEYASTSLRCNRRTLPSTTASTIKRFCETFDTTPSALFRLGWALVLTQTCGTQYPTFGYITSGRDRAHNAERIVGPCLNIVPCVPTFHLSTTVKESLVELQQQFLQGLEHQSTFLEYAASLGRDRSPTTTLFDTMVNFRRHVAEQATTSLEIKPLAEVDPFDVYIVDVDSIIKLKCWQYALVVEIDHYSADVFDITFSYWEDAISNAEAERLGDSLCNILEATTDSPDGLVLQRSTFHQIG